MMPLKRYDELVAKRQDETLTSEEHAELLHLTNEIELLNAKLMENLVALANIRQVSLPQLMQDLGMRDEG